MIVDNIPENREKMMDYIQQHFINVIIHPEVTTGHAAIALATASIVEILILNLDVTDVDGFQLMQQLMQIHPNMRTILTSQREDFALAQLAIRAGVIDYLIQPLDDAFIFSLDRAIQSINRVSLFHDNQAKRTFNAAAPNSATQKMVLFMQDNYPSNISLQDLADHMHLNLQYTSKLFKEQVGMNFITYLVHLRIERAKHLLSTTNQSITAIALAVGYPEPTYFSKLYKKHTDYTPQQYRKLFQGERIPVDTRAVGL